MSRLRVVLPAFERDVLPRLTAGLRVDLGCAAGHLLARLGPNAVGVDLDPLALRDAKAQGAPVMRADLNATVPLADGVADAVVCSHVLEHVEAPIQLVRECGRILKPGGVLALCVPTPATVSMLWTGDRYYRGHSGPGGHLYTFEPEGLGVLLGRSGFQRPEFVADPPLSRKLAAVGCFRPMQWMMALLPTRLWPRVAPSLWAVAKKATAPASPAQGS
jgi:SAM-dependent methyltransferase